MKKLFMAVTCASALMAGTCFGNDGPGSNGSLAIQIIGPQTAYKIVTQCAGSDDPNQTVDDVTSSSGEATILYTCINDEIKKVPLDGNCSFAANGNTTLFNVVTQIQGCATK